MVEDVFSPQSLLEGVRISAAQCACIPNAVWVVVDGIGECIRIYSAGLAERNRVAVVFIHGDRLGGTEPVGYADNSTAKQEQKASAVASELRLPYIAIARPGTYGSSGKHTHRREMRELKLVNVALDAIKARHQLERFAIAGQSGGAAVASYLLTQRSDLACLVLTSGALSLGTIMRLNAASVYDTGNPGLYNPIRHVSEIPVQPNRPIFIIGDPKDRLSPLANQHEYYQALVAAGHPAWFALGSATGSGHHTLDGTGRTVASWSAAGMAPSDILERFAQGAILG